MARNLRPILLILTVAVAIGFLAWRYFGRPVTTPMAAGSTPVAVPLTTRQSLDVQRSDVTKADAASICGYPNASIDKDNPDAINNYVSELAKGATARWLSALKDSGDLRARVTGLLLEDRVDGGLKHAASEQTSEAVVQLAAGSQDPAVYAMAVTLCDTYSGAGANVPCQQISLQRWTQLDTDNAVPWLLLAEQDRARRDDAAAADAFTRAAEAHKIDSYSESLYDFSTPELPQDLTSLEQAYLATEVIGVEAAMPLPHYRVLDQYCSSDAMRDRSTRQRCNAFAELLVGRGTTLLDLYLGRKLGARAGWHSERVNALLEEQNALHEAAREGHPSCEDNFWTCECVDRLNASLARRLKLGELGAARDALARSGETRPDMAKKYTQYLESIRREALSGDQSPPADSAR